MSNKTMTEIMNSMELVNEPGIRNPRAAVQEGKTGLVDSKNSMTNAMLAYDRILEKEGVKIKEQKEDVLHNIILEDKDKVRFIGAIQVIKELVNREYGKTDPKQILIGVKKIVDSFQ